MSFVLLDDQIAQHPKVLRAGAEAAWLWAVSIAYCSRQLTDGAVPTEALETLGRFKTSTAKLAATLVSVRLFDADGANYRVHDYLEHNPTKAMVLERRRKAAERKAASRAHRGQSPSPTPGPAGDKPVTPMSQRDTAVTDSASRGRVPTPTPTPTPIPTDAESASVGARTGPVGVTRPDWGASPAQRHSPSHAWQSAIGLHVPMFLHNQFSDRLRNAGVENAEPTLLAWYAFTEQAWRGRKVGETAVKFWEARFEDEHGRTERAAPKRVRQAPEDDGWVPPGHPDRAAYEARKQKRGVA